jgi:hypothetical protein
VQPPLQHHIQKDCKERERERERGANREAGAALFFYWRNEKFENDVILEDFVKFSKLPDFNDKIQ